MVQLPPRGPAMVLHAFGLLRFASRQTIGVRLRGASVTFCMAAPLFVAPASALRSEDSSADTIMYSEEQALTSHDLYNEHCASCHGAALRRARLNASARRHVPCTMGRRPSLRG